MICHWDTIQQLKFRILRSITLANLKISREMYGKETVMIVFTFSSWKRNITKMIC